MQPTNLVNGRVVRCMCGLTDFGSQITLHAYLSQFRTVDMERLSVKESKLMSNLFLIGFPNHTRITAMTLG